MSSNLSPAKAANYLREVVQESKLISWPTLNQVGFQFLVVIGLSAILTCLLYIIDISLAAGINTLKETFVK